MPAYAIYRLPHEDHATLIRQTDGEPLQLSLVDRTQWSMRICSCTFRGVRFFACSCDKTGHR